MYTYLILSWPPAVQEFGSSLFPVERISQCSLMSEPLIRKEHSFRGRESPTFRSKDSMKENSDIIQRQQSNVLARIRNLPPAIGLLQACNGGKPLSYTFTKTLVSYSSYVLKSPGPFYFAITSQLRPLASNMRITAVVRRACPAQLFRRAIELQNNLNR